MRLTALSSLSALSLLSSALPFNTAHAAQNLPAIAPVAACSVDSFAHVSLREAPARVTSAEIGDVDGNPMCVIEGMISPQIRFLVHLPAKGWTQRYLQTGCGGLCGRLAIHSPQRDCQFEQDGTMAMASTDMGHRAGIGGLWAASDMQLRVDFGYRGVHTTALIAKELIKVYYGQKPAFSYFSGCSDGGREALMSAQRYPEDFDGIAAGAPSLNFLAHNSMYHGWNARIVQAASPNPAVRERDLPILNRRALAECDTADGLKDGIISDPTCQVDPLQWVCGPGENDNCLSRRTALAAAELYRGAHEGETKLVIGSLLPGSELSWLNVLVPRELPPTPMANTPTASGSTTGSPAAPTAGHTAAAGSGSTAFNPISLAHAASAVESTQASTQPTRGATTAGLAPSGQPGTATTRAQSGSAPTDAKAAGSPAQSANTSASTSKASLPPRPTEAPAMDQLYFAQPVSTASPKSAQEILQSLAFIDPYDPDWKLSDFRFEASVFERLKPMHALLDATNPDLGPFHRAGGKLLIWHGLGDPHIAPANSMAYYQAVRDTIGQEATDEVMRLFLVPGLGHCGGGHGLRSLDAMTPLIDWVENGQAPKVLRASASHADAALGKGRNIHPFPYTSALKTDGDPNTPTDWARGKRLAVDDTLYKGWAGEDFFTPGFQQFCGFDGMAFVCRDKP
ncbi:MAG: tannase/feruloyl esterase family alpha/beta hydrolase [Lautropia sp.]|nr:tannase/feruloyl esterase family alpha/beta hydrolase [Lautropia sp.]